MMTRLAILVPSPGAIPLFVVLTTSIWAGSAHANLLTGNPLDDAWEFFGNSADPGIYAAGSSSINFDLYRAAFFVDSPLTFGSPNWMSRDVVLGVGGVILSASGNDARLDLIRFVTKWGTPQATFSPGNVSFSGGAGGAGSIQLATLGGNLDPNLSGFLAPGVLHRFTDNRRFDGTSSVVLANDDFGRFIYLPNGPNLGSFQVLINISYVQRVFGLPAPQEYTAMVMNLQRGGGSRIEAIVLNTGVPEPGTLTLGMLIASGMGVAVAVARRRSIPTTRT